MDKKYLQKKILRVSPAARKVHQKVETNQAYQKKEEKKE